MESLSKWLGENASAVWATIISFMSVYGVALLSLVVGIIKTKLTAIQQAKASDEKLEELTTKTIKRLEELEQAVIEASNVNTEKRIKAMQEIADTVNAANEALQEAEQSNVASALDSLE